MKRTREPQEAVWRKLIEPLPGRGPGQQRLSVLVGQECASIQEHLGL